MDRYREHDMRKEALVGLVLSAVLPLSGAGLQSGAEATGTPSEHARGSAKLVGAQDGYYFDFNRRQSRRPHQQWSLRAIGAAKAWRLSRGAGVRIAVIDSGIGPTWELRGQALPGVNMAGRVPARVDVVDHGTAVSSLIAARSDHKGITGVAPRAKLVPVRIFDGYDAPMMRLVRAIRWAIRQRVDIINLSVVERDSPQLRAAVRKAVRHRIIVVAGAGNERASGSPVQYPAAYPGVIAVGAVAKNRKLADFSNEGDYVDVVAPGDRVLAADPFGTLSWYSGTSFSTPMVTGVVALMKAAHPRLGPAQAERILRATATDLGETGRDRLYGSGLVDAERAVRAARKLRG
jgi:subtilisin family serine protease